MRRVRKLGKAVLMQSDGGHPGFNPESGGWRRRVFQRTRVISKVPLSFAHS